MSQRYGSEEAFRRALEERLKNAARASKRNLVRERQVLLFERFLVRACAVEDIDLVVKGGMAVELRTERARSTKDIDVRAMGAPSRFEAALGEVATSDMGDFLKFRVEPHRRPDLDSAGMRYPGKRFRVQALLAGKLYGDPFGLDVAFGEPILGRPERIRGRSDLSFVGLERPEFAVYPRATHIAEKLHAYTLPRPTPNSRIKDLPDLAILAGVGSIEGVELRSALEQTFEHRATHALPGELQEPPARWRDPYSRVAREDELRWPGLEDVFEAVSAFLNPVLRGDGVRWDPSSWQWDRAMRVQDSAWYTVESVWVRGQTPMVALRSSSGELREILHPRRGRELCAGDHVLLSTSGEILRAKRGRDLGWDR